MIIIVVILIIVILIIIIPNSSSNLLQSFFGNAEAPSTTKVEDGTIVEENQNQTQSYRDWLILAQSHQNQKYPLVTHTVYQMNSRKGRNHLKKPDGLHYGQPTELFQEAQEIASHTLGSESEVTLAANLGVQS